MFYNLMMKMYLTKKNVSTNKISFSQQFNLLLFKIKQSRNVKMSAETLEIKFKTDDI